MKHLIAIIALMLFQFGSFGATVYPASTNGNNVFTGLNSFTQAPRANGMMLTNINNPDGPYSGPFLNLPTFDGTNTCTHPSICVSTNGQIAYRYWIGYTPFPPQGREWASVAASHDMINWEVPSGMSSNVLFTPQDAFSIFPPYATITAYFSADPEIVQHTNGSLVLFSLLTRDCTNTMSAVAFKTSTNGINWSVNPTVAFAATNSVANSNGAPIISPQFVTWTNGLPRIYYVNEINKTNTIVGKAVTNQLSFRQASDWTLTNWSIETNCYVPIYAVNNEVRTNVWHFDIQRLAGKNEYYSLMGMKNGVRGQFLMHSDNGIDFTWEGNANAIQQFDKVIDHDGWYKCDMRQLSDSPVRWDVVFGTIDSVALPTANWRIGAYRNVELPMPKADFVCSQASTNGYMSRIYPLASAMGTKQWGNIAGYLLGNTFSVESTKTVRYIDYEWTTSTNYVQAGIARLFASASASWTGEAVAYGGNTNSSGRRIDIGRTILVPGEYLVWFWTPTTNTTVKHWFSNGTGDQCTNAPVAMQINSQSNTSFVNPVVGQVANLIPTAYNLQAIFISPDYLFHP